MWDCKRYPDIHSQHRNRIRYLFRGYIKGLTFAENTSNMLGCNARELVEYLMMDTDIKWDELPGYEIHHIKPLSSMKRHADLKELYHFSNMELIKKEDHERLHRSNRKYTLGKEELRGKPTPKKSGGGVCKITSPAGQTSPSPSSAPTGQA